MASNAGERRMLFKKLMKSHYDADTVKWSLCRLGKVWGFHWRNAMALVDSTWWQTLYSHGCDIGSDFSQLCLALICWSDTSPEHSTALSPFTHDLPKRCCDEDRWNWNLREQHTHLTGDVFSSVLGMLQILGEHVIYDPGTDTSTHPYIPCNPDPWIFTKQKR